MSELDEFCKNTTPEERVEAALWFYRTEGVYDYDTIYRYITIGVRLVGDEGWRCVAPAWIRAIRHQGGENDS